MKNVAVTIGAIIAICGAEELVCSREGHPSRMFYRRFLDLTNHPVAPLNTEKEEERGSSIPAHSLSALKADISKRANRMLD